MDNLFLTYKIKHVQLNVMDAILTWNAFIVHQHTSIILL